MFKEFKSFAIKGNMVDMAVGIIIGTAFSKIVTSLVQDIIMPPFGLVIGEDSFSRYVFTLREASETAAAVTINYGVFANTVLHFLIVAFTMFIVVKQMNKLRTQKEKAPAAPAEEVLLLREIRDALKATK